MSDNNKFDDIEFIDLNETASDTKVPSQAPVSEYRSPDEAEDIFNTSARHHSVDDDDYKAPVRKSHSSSSRAERRRRRRRKLLIRRAIFCCALVAFVVSATMLIKALLSYNKADKIYQEIEGSVFSENTTKPTSSSGTDVNAPTDSNTSTSAGETEADFHLLTNYDHDALLAINPDAVGYLQIPALNLLLPVVQGTDNEYYLSHTLNGESSKSGTLFIDCNNKDGIESQNTIIYGHNMKNGSMFGSLRKYIQSDFYSKGDNKYFYFYVENKIYKYEIYSVHTTPSVSETYTTEFASTDAFFTYIDTMLRASYHKSDLDFYNDSKTITFSTCTNDDNTRLVVQAVRIEELLQ